MNDLNEVVCGCNNITRNDIKEQISAGVSTYDELEEKTNIGIYCPPCKEGAIKVFNEIKNQLNL